MQKGIAAGEDYLTIRNRRVAAIKAEARTKMRLFGCSGKADQSINGASENEALVQLVTKYICDSLRSEGKL